MSKLVLLLFLFSILFTAKGQNLVPNGDFEQYSGCPNNLSQLDSALFWFNPSTNIPSVSGTSDYFNQCAPINNVGVPNNVMGYQSAHSGVAYAGIILFYIAPWREYIEVPLTSVLVANSCYHFEMYVCLAEVGKYTTDDIGIYFSNTAITGINNPYPLPFIPQLNNISGNVFDTLNWTLVSGNYIAMGGESYLIIGNFKDDSNTDTIIINNNAPWSYAYVYIDDVSLSPCTGIDEFAISSSEFTVYPNPAGEFIIISSEFGEKNNYELTIKDIQGRICLRTLNSKLPTKLNISAPRSPQISNFFIEDFHALIDFSKSCNQEVFPLRS